MTKFGFGLFALCALVGCYLGSLFGTAIAICVFMTISGLIEEMARNRRKKDRSDKEENKDA